MLKLMRMAAVVSAAASISLAAGVSGNYIEARTADVFTGPCFANGEVEMNGKEACSLENHWRSAGCEPGRALGGRSHSIRHTLGNVYEPVNR